MEDGSNVFNTLDFSEASIEDEHIKRDILQSAKAVYTGAP